MWKSIPLQSNYEFKIMMVVELGHPLSSNKYTTILPVLCLCASLCVKGKAAFETKIPVNKKSCQICPPETLKEIMRNHRSLRIDSQPSGGV